MESMLTKTQLTSRGWTDSLMRRLLGDPDQTKPNPHRRSGPPMRLFAEDRVAAAETLPEFQARLKAKASRSEGARKAVQTRRNNDLAWCEAVRFTIRRLPIEKVRRDAVRAYEHSGIERFGVRDAGDGQDFLDRITVNYIRHHLTDYDVAIDGMRGRMSQADIYTAMKNRVLAAIADAYPSLAAECQRQSCCA